MKKFDLEAYGKDLELYKENETLTVDVTKLMSKPDQRKFLRLMFDDGEIEPADVCKSLGVEMRVYTETYFFDSEFRDAIKKGTALVRENLGLKLLKKAMELAEETEGKDGAQRYRAALDAYKTIGSDLKSMINKIGSDDSKFIPPSKRVVKQVEEPSKEHDYLDDWKEVTDGLQGEEEAGENEEVEGPDVQGMAN